MYKSGEVGFVTITNNITTTLKHDHIWMADLNTISLIPSHCTQLAR